VFLFTVRAGMTCDASVMMRCPHFPPTHRVHAAAALLLAAAEHADHEGHLPELPGAPGGRGAGRGRADGAGAGQR